MASRGEAVSLAEQAEYAQRKLKKLYRRTHRALYGYKGAIELLQETLLWQKPAASLMLYVAIHWVFINIVYASNGGDTFLSQLGVLLMWLLLGDLLWRAASRHDNTESAGHTRMPKSQSKPKEMPFEIVVVQMHGSGSALASYDVLCLWIADYVMWMDNIWLAIRHWSINEPFIFSAVLACPGLVLSLLGRYVPTVVLCYLLVMALVLWPYVSHSSLLPRAAALAQQTFPGLEARAKALWTFVKTLATRSEDSPEFALTAEDEQRTQQALQEAFNQETTSQQQQQQQQQEQQLVYAKPLAPRQNEELSESTLGVGGLDSLMIGPGAGEFPSISHLDMSLALTSFPPGQAYDGGGAEYHAAMPTISEEDALSTGPSTDSLEPFSAQELDNVFTRSSQPSQSHQAQNRGQNQQTATSPSSQFTGRFTPPPSYSDAMAEQPLASLGFTTQQFPPGDPRGLYEFPQPAAPPQGEYSYPRAPKLSNVPPTSSSTPMGGGSDDGSSGGTTTVRHRNSSGANFEALADELLSL